MFIIACLLLLAHVGLILLLIQSFILSYNQKLWYELTGSSILILVLSCSFYFVTKLL